MYPFPRAREVRTTCWCIPTGGILRIFNPFFVPGRTALATREDSDQATLPTRWKLTKILREVASGGLTKMRLIGFVRFPLDIYTNS